MKQIEQERLEKYNREHFDKISPNVTRRIKSPKRVVNESKNSPSVRIKARSRSKSKPKVLKTSKIPQKTTKNNDDAIFIESEALIFDKKVKKKKDRKRSKKLDEKIREGAIDKTNDIEISASEPKSKKDSLRQRSKSRSKGRSNKKADQKGS